MRSHQVEPTVLEVLGGLMAMVVMFQARGQDGRSLCSMRPDGLIAHTATPILMALLPNCRHEGSQRLLVQPGVCVCLCMCMCL